MGGLKEIKSIMCMQSLLLLLVSTWSMRTRDMRVDQDGANEVTEALYGNAREEKEAGTLAMALR